MTTGEFLKGSCLDLIPTLTYKYVFKHASDQLVNSLNGPSVRFSLLLNSKF